MGAGDRWHEHGPVKDGDPIISPAILLLMQGKGNTTQSVLPWETDHEAAFGPESTRDGSPEGEDTLANLLRAIENTEIAASFPSLVLPESGNPRARICAREEEVAGAGSTPFQEPAPRADAAACFAQPAESAETPVAAFERPEVDWDAHLGATPQDAMESASAAISMDDLESIETAVGLDAATELDEESFEIAPSGQDETMEAASIPEPPLFGARRNSSRQQNRQPKRGVRRRDSDRGRSDYLLSIAGSTPATPPIAIEPKPTGSGASAEPAEMLASIQAPAIPVLPASSELEIVEPLEPAKPDLAAVSTADAEPELPRTAEPAFTDDTPILPAARESGTQRAPIRAKLGGGIGSLSATGDLINGGLDRAEMHLENWFQKWLGPPDPRRDVRVDKPPLVAYHWIVDVPQALKVANVSAGGLYLVTGDRWSEGNIVSMTLQRTDREKGSPDSWIAVDFLVMRWCEDGMAGAFMPSVRGLAYTVAGRAGNCADKKTLTRFIDRLIDAAADRLALCK